MAFQCALALKFSLLLVPLFPFASCSFALLAELSIETSQRGQMDGLVPMFLACSLLCIVSSHDYFFLSQDPASSDEGGDHLHDSEHFQL